MGPVGWVILAIGALTAAIYFNRAKLKEWSDAWSKFLVDVGSDVLGFVIRDFNRLSDFFSEFTAEVSGVWDKIVETWKSTLDGFFSWFSEKWNSISGAVGSTWEKMKGILGGGTSGETAKAAPSSFVPPEAMPVPGGNRTTNNTVNVQVSAPGQDGAGIARQIRTALQSQPLYDADGVLVPA